jgi:hypothetical protein
MPTKPDKRFVVVHPAFRFSQAHSVLTTFYRMQYVDDPLDIIDNMNVLDPDTEAFVLDDDNFQPLPEPCLLTIDANSIVEHTLMLPYHPCSKFMVGVRGQSNWANEFLNTD